MKKKFNLKIFVYVLIAFIVLTAVSLMPEMETEAAGKEAVFKIEVSSSEVTKGETVTVTVSCESTVSMGYLQWNVKYPTEKLGPADGEKNLAGVMSETLWFEDKNDEAKVTSKTFKFKALAVGKVDFKVEHLEIYRLDDEGGKLPDEISVEKNIAKLNIVEKGKSNDATLSSLVVNAGESSGNSLKEYTISPKFSKDVFEYKVTVPHSAKVGYVFGKTSDSGATQEMSGADEFLEYGDNKRVVTVTAPDGTVKKYTVNIFREAAPTAAPTKEPTAVPTKAPTSAPTAEPTAEITNEPTEEPTAELTEEPTLAPETSSPEPSKEPGDEALGSVTTSSENFEIYDINQYFDIYGKPENLNAAVFMIDDVEYTGISERDVQGNTVFIVYAQPEGGMKELYTIDVYDRSMQRYYELLQSKPEGTDSEEKPTDDNTVDAPVVVEKNNEIKFFVLAGFLLAAIVLAVIAIVLVAKKSGDEDDEEEEEIF